MGRTHKDSKKQERDRQKIKSVKQGTLKKSKNHKISKIDYDENFE